MGCLSGIINFVEMRITNAILERINNKIQRAKRRARGYRNIGLITHSILHRPQTMDYSLVIGH